MEIGQTGKHTHNLMDEMKGEAKGKKIEKYKVEEWTVPNGEKKHFYAISGQNKSKK